MNESNRKKLMYGILVVAVLWGAWNFTHPPKRYKPGSEPVTVTASTTMDSVTSKTPVIDIEAKRSEPWGRDPFRSGQAPSTQLVTGSYPRRPVANAGWSLTGILYSATAPLAFINGRMVKVGDMIDHALVVTILKQKVTLSVNGRTFDIFVNKG